MRLRVRHVTEYDYGDTVPLCHNVVHLRPRDTASQQCLTHDLFVTPAPGPLRRGVDFFGNPVAWFSVQESHGGLSVRAESVVEVTPRDADVIHSPAWDTIMPDDESTPFTFDSPHVPRSAELADYATESFLPGRPVADAAADLTHRIHKDFKFVSGVTTVGTPVLAVLRDRRGVCQDFSHLMIGCLRSLGLAARYVSGYLMTRPPPGKPKLAGCDASHAWASVHVPGVGWVDFDPTNDCRPGVQHVTVGWARDYGDIGPVQGVIVGGHQHSLRVAVDVAEEGDRRQESGDKTSSPHLPFHS